MASLLFGGSFVILAVAFIVGGLIGMVRNAGPRQKRPKRTGKTPGDEPSGTETAKIA